MSGRFLLDTSIVIALFAEDTSVEEHLKEAEEVLQASFSASFTLVSANQGGFDKT